MRILMKGNLLVNLFLKYNDNVFPYVNVLIAIIPSDVITVTSLPRIDWIHFSPLYQFLW